MNQPAGTQSDVDGQQHLNLENDTAQDNISDNLKTYTQKKSGSKIIFNFANKKCQ